MICVNCNNDFDSNFCPNCGQKKDVERITLSSLVEHMFSSLANMDKGFLFNLKHLTIHPRKTVLNFIQGKRKQVLNPINYAFFTISAYLFLSYLLKEYRVIEMEEEIAKRIENMSKLEKIGFDTGKNLFENLKFYWFLMTFSLSAFTKLLFKKYNYFEHLAINFFVVGHATILGILSKLIFHKEIILFNFLVFFYMIFMIYKIFKIEKEKGFSVTMAIISVGFAYLVFFAFPMIRILYLNI